MRIDHILSQTTSLQVISLLNSCIIRTQFEKAKDFFNQALVIYEKGFGKNHIETTRVLRNLRQTYILDGRLEVAETLLKTILEIFQAPHHPKSYKSLELLAELFLKRATQAREGGNIQLSQTFKKNY